MPYDETTPYPAPDPAAGGRPPRPTVPAEDRDGRRDPAPDETAPLRAPAGTTPSPARPAGPDGHTPTAPTAHTAEDQPTAPVRVSARAARPPRVTSRSGHVVPVTSGGPGPEDVLEPTLRPGVVPPQRSAPPDLAPSGGSPSSPAAPSEAAPPATEPPSGTSTEPHAEPVRSATPPAGPVPAPRPAPAGGRDDSGPQRDEQATDAPPRAVDEPLPPVRLGVVVSPQVTELLGDGLLHLDTVLRDTLGGDSWEVTVVDDAVADRGPGALDVLEAARDRLLEEDWDLAVVLTSVPLLDGRRAVVTQTAPVHGVGVVSVPALGAVHVRSRARRAVARLVGELVYVPVTAQGERPEEDAQRVRGRLRQLTADDDAAAPGGVRLAARVLGGNAGLLLAMIRANRPWRLLAPLSRALTAAGAAAVLTLVTTDLWLLADAFGVGRLLLLAVLSVLAVSVALVAGAHLWERPRRSRERRQVALFNLATAGTVLVGVVVLHVALLVLALLGAALLVDAGVLAALLGREPDGGTWWRLAWLTASLATVAGAIGAGLEDDDVVRAAAYTRSRESVDDAVGREPDVAGRESGAEGQEPGAEGQESGAEGQESGVGERQPDDGPRVARES